MCALSLHFYDRRRGGGEMGLHTHSIRSFLCSRGFGSFHRARKVTASGTTGCTSAARVKVRAKHRDKNGTAGGWPLAGTAPRGSREHHQK